MPLHVGVAHDGERPQLRHREIIESSDTKIFPFLFYDWFKVNERVVLSLDMSRREWDGGIEQSYLTA